MVKILNFKIERIKRGWTMQEVADKIGVSRPWISYLENGKQLPSQLRRKQLSELFEVDALYLFSEVGK